jgi:hypothetical protein
VVLILVVIFGRRGGTAPTTAAGAPQAPPSDVEPTVSLDKTAPAPATGGGARPAWMDESRRWIAESRAVRRERVRRAFPVKVATLLTLVAALLTLGVIDSAHGIAIPLYFWFALAILGAGLLVGMVLRRAPWSVGVLLIPTVIGLIAFAGSHASLHDGVGQRVWTPTSTVSSSYRLAFGQATLDLRSLHAQSGPRAIRVEQAGGRLHIIAPKTMKLTVVANVHFGVVLLDGDSPDQSGGAGVSRLVEPLAGASGQPITIDVHLADGEVSIDRR